MRRCYRGAALLLGLILFASNSLSNSCSFMTLNVYAAEAAHSEETVTLDAYESLLAETTEIVKVTRTAKATDKETVTESAKHTGHGMYEKFAAQNGIQTGEENVDTEIPADDPDPSPSGVEEGTNKKNIYLKLKEYNVLLKIVEAEAGGEDITGKMLVANVIMNRINSSRFPDTVTEVVYQKTNGKAQFSPTVDGRIESVTVSEATVEAVERVLNGEDSSNGALYFRSVRSNGTWHDSALRRVLEHGNHIFYTI